MKLSQINPADKAQKVLVYGPPKSGKTLLVGRLAEAGYNLTILDLDLGCITLVHNLSDEAKERVDVIQIPDTKERPQGIETVSQIFRDPAKLHKICEEHGRINCPTCTRENKEFYSLNISEFTSKHVLVIDSFSQLSDSCMAYVASDVKGLDLNDKLGEYTRVEFKHYDAQGRILSAICSAIQAAKFNVVVITHDQDVGGEHTESIVPKGGTRNFAKSFGRYFDHIVYTEVMNKKHIAYSGTTDKPTVQIGGRSGVSLKEGGGLVNLLSGEPAPKETGKPAQQAPATGSKFSSYLSKK